MGTAETGWVRCTNAKTDRRECAVVPPGQTAEHTEWGEMFDDRDTTELTTRWAEELFGAEGRLNDKIKGGVAA